MSGDAFDINSDVFIKDDIIYDHIPIKCHFSSYSLYLKINLQKINQTFRNYWRITNKGVAQTPAAFQQKINHPWCLHLSPLLNQCVCLSAVYNYSSIYQLWFDTQSNTLVSRPAAHVACTHFDLSSCRSCFRTRLMTFQDRCWNWSLLLLRYSSHGKCAKRNPHCRNN